MNSAMRPSTLGEILDRTANLYRAHFMAFLGIAAPPAAILLGCMGGMVLLLTTTGTRPENALIAGLGVLGIGLMGIPLYAGAGALSTAAISHAASAVFLEEPITIRGSYRAAWKRGWSYVGLYFLQGLAIMAAPVILWTIAVTVLAVMAGLARQAGAGASAAATGFLLLVGAGLVVYAVWMLLMLCMAFPAAVVEGVGPWTALKRAAALSKGTRGRVLVLYVLGVAIGWIVSIVFMSPIFLLALVPSLSRPEKSQLLGTIMIILFYGISFAVQALTKPIYGIAVVLFYYDQRVRKEGFDIEWMMRQAGMVSGPVAGAVAGVPEVARAVETWPESHPVGEVDTLAQAGAETPQQNSGGAV
ncbi:MAG TPA: hypothetical protein VG267_10000 [Terracidiphilus sp.]|jgi:hypothetical protein|nr:hypothetical protein [Terracidiphilus sp.]